MMRRYNEQEPTQELPLLWRVDTSMEQKLKIRRKTPFLERRKTEGLDHVDGYRSILAWFKFVYELHAFSFLFDTLTP